MTTYLSPTDLPHQLRHLHGQGHIRVHLATQATIPAQAGLWSGGTIEHYAALELSSGQTHALSTAAAPWDASRTQRTYTLRPGYGVIKTGSFCGKPAGLTLYIHPSDAWPALAAPAPDLTDLQRQVLTACVTTKAGASRWEHLTRNSVTRAQYDATIPELQRLGLLAANKAPTPQGRNLVNTLLNR